MRVVRLLQAVDRGNVRVIERRENFCLALKSSQALFIFGELVRQDLDRHIPAELSIACTINVSHPAFANGLEDLVVVEFRAG